MRSVSRGAPCQLSARRTHIDGTLSLNIGNRGGGPRRAPGRRRGLAAAKAQGNLHRRMTTLTVIPVQTGIHGDAVGFAQRSMSAVGTPYAHRCSAIAQCRRPGRWTPACAGATARPRRLLSFLAIPDAAKAQGNLHRRTTTLTVIPVQTGIHGGAVGFAQRSTAAVRTHIDAALSLNVENRGGGPRRAPGRRRSLPAQHAGPSCTDDGAILLGEGSGQCGDDLQHDL